MALAGASMAERDFVLTTERAAGLVLDAGIAARAAARRPISAPRRRQMRAAIASLERAQEHLWAALSSPASSRAPAEHLQLELL